MADNPQRPVAPTRPLSPHMTIYRWPVTMMTSIAHRVTGVGLSMGTVILATSTGQIQLDHDAAMVALLQRIAAEQGQSPDSRPTRLRTTESVDGDDLRS